MRVAGWFVVLLALCTAPRAAADVPRAGTAAPRVVAGRLTAYEARTVAALLAARDAAVDPAPEGKRIGRVEVVTLDVVAPGEPFPVAVNALHRTSREAVVRRELLFAAGDRYCAALVAESERILRALPQLSTVLVVALASELPHTVDVLVVTKDVWSLIVDFDARAANGLDHLLLAPRESNWRGRHQDLSVPVLVRPSSVDVGVAFSERRLGSTLWATEVGVGAITNRASGDLEGSHGRLVLTRPLRHSRARWGGRLGLAWTSEIERLYRAGEVREWDGPTPALTAAARVEDLRWEQRSVTETLEAGVVRSWGWRGKSDLSLLLRSHRETHRRVRALEAPALARAFDAGLAPSETVVAPHLGWHAHATDHLRTQDLARLGLQEDVPLGYDLVLGASPVTRALGSTRDYLALEGTAQYGLRLGDGVARARVGGQVDLTPRGEVPDASARADLFLASPRFAVGRVVAGTHLEYRPANYRHTQTSLGASTRVRGYADSTRLGEHLWVTNLELRTRSFDLASLQVGGTAFYDAGTLLAAPFTVLQSIGAGVRWVIPQIDRAVWRLDAGFPVGRSVERPRDAPVVVSFAFGSSFDLGGLTGAVE